LLKSLLRSSTLPPTVTSAANAIELKQTVASTANTAKNFFIVYPP
jgi:hypothetical protein